MEFPSWFQHVIQQRLDHVSAQVEHQPELYRCRDEEDTAFHAMFSGMDKTQLQAFMGWEEQFHLRRSLENERLYLQGLRDGAQLVFTLLSDPLSSGDKMLEASKKTASKSDKSEA